MKRLFLPVVRVLTWTALVLAMTAWPAAASTIITWANPSGGSWSDPGNWSPANVPDAAGEEAVLPALSGAYTVTLDVSPAIDRIDIAAGDPTLDVNGQSLASVGFVDNHGTVLNFTGLYNSDQIANRAGGVIRGAYDGVIQTVNGTTLVNDGTLIVGPGQNSKLLCTGAITFGGTGTIELDHSKIYDPADDPYGTSAKLNAGATITGTGGISKRLYLQGGTLEATAGSYLKVDGLLFSYGGTIRVSGGGVIRVNRPLVKLYNASIVAGPGGGVFSLVMDSQNRGTIDLMNGGQIVTDGGNLSVSCGQLVDGELLTTANGGEMSFDVASWQDVHINSGLKVTVTEVVDAKAPGTSRHIQNDGELVLRGGFFGMTAPQDTMWLDGAGIITLDGGSIGNGNMNGSTGLIVNASGMTIRGCGTIYPPFVNEGTIEIDCSNLIQYPGTWINRGLMRVRTRGQLTVTGANTVLQNRGRIEADRVVSIEKQGTIDNAGGVIVAKDRVQLGTSSTLGTLVGGQLEAGGAGHYYVARGATLKDVTIGTSGVLQIASNATLNVGGYRFTNLGTTRIAGSLVADPTAEYFQSQGTTRLEGGSLVSAREVQLIGGSLEGAGTVMAGVTSGGRVAPALGTNPLRIQGNWTQMPSGSLEIALAGEGTERCGHFAVSGNAALAGAMTPVLATGYAPTAGLSWNVFTFASKSGGFTFPSAGTSTASADILPYFTAGAMTLVAGGTTGVGGGATIASLRFYGLSAPRGASFVLELPAAATVQGRVYDAAGREVGRLADGVLPAGAHTFAVNGAGGVEGLASGVYFARMSIASGGTSEVRNARVVVMR